jgi:glutamine amidotransferase
VCRWLGYAGAPIRLEDLLFLPEHSLIEQSRAARESEYTTNGDGFGVGWYGNQEHPGIYKDVLPAWNDPNLGSLARQVESGLFLAHVRATTGSAVQHTNCHPFGHGRWLLVHNGAIAEFTRLRRDLMMEVDPELFPFIRGTTDSEVIFYLAFTYGLEDEPIPALERAVGVVEAIAAKHGVESPVQASLGLADGERMYGVRYASAETPRTLYVSKDIEAIREINPELADRLPPEARAVVSEPLSALDALWREIPPSTAVTVEGGEVEARPFRPRT